MNRQKIQTFVLAVFTVVFVGSSYLFSGSLVPVQAANSGTSGAGVVQTFSNSVNHFFQGLFSWLSPHSTLLAAPQPAASNSNLSLAEIEPLIQQSLAKYHLPVIQTTQYLTTKILQQPIYTTTTVNNATTVTNTVTASTAAVSLDGGSSAVAGTLPVLNGGTGLSSLALGDVLFANSSTTLARRSIGRANQVLTVIAGVPVWATVTGNGGTCPDCLVSDPGNNQVLQATNSGAVSLSVRQPASGTADIFDVTDPTGTVNYFRIDQNGNVVLGTGGAFADANLTVSPTGKDPLAITPTAQGVTAYTGNITSETLTTTRDWTFPDQTGTVCLTTGNCLMAGTGVSSAGTTNYIAKFQNSTTLANSLLYDNGTNVGIGTVSPNYKLDVNGTLHTVGAISGGSTVTGTTLNATNGVNTGAGAGTQRIDANGNLVNIGNITANGTQTFSGFTTNNGLLYTNGAGVMAQTGQGLANMLLHGNGDSTPIWSGVDLTADVLNILSVANGGTNGTATPTAGAIAYGTGSAYAFMSANATSGLCLISGGAGAPSWASCGGSGGTVWQSLNGAIVPLNSTQDFLVGGQTTASAQFAVNATTGDVQANGNFTALGNLTAAGASLSSSLWVGSVGNQLQVNSLGELDMAYTGNSGNLTGQGAFTLDNTNNIGNGLGLVTNASDSAQGDLLNIAVNNRNFQNAGLHLSYYGNRNGLEIVNNGNNSASNALAVTGNNINDSTLGIIGYELGKGTIKISHYRPAGLNDNNAAGISIDLRGSGTAAQGLYVNSTEVGGTTGDLLRLRNQSIDKFFVDYQGNVTQGGYGYNTTYTKYGNTTGDQFFVGTNGAFKVARAVGNSEAFRVQINGDTQGRWLGTSDGSLKWGSGALAQDVTLYRTAVGILALNGGMTFNNTNGLYDTVIKGSTDSNLFYANATTDKIGIGTSNPIGALQISKNGTGNAALIVNQLDNTSNIISASTSGSLKFAVDPTGDLISSVGAGWRPVTDSLAALQIQNSSGTTMVDFDTTNGRVGIGTATPSGALQVTSGTVSIGATATDTLFVATNGALKLTRTSANSEAMRTVVSGDTQGRLLITSDGQMKWGSGSLAQDVVLQRGSAGQMLLTGGMTFNNTNGLYDTVIKGSSDNNLFYANATSDKIGFGLSNPVGAVQISKDGTGNADLIVNQTGASDILTASASGATKFTVDASGNLISAAGAGWKPLTDSLAALQIRNSSGTSIMNFDTTNNRVGIGTATPSGALQVSSGTVAFGAVTTDQFFVAANGAFKVTRASANSEAFRTQVNGDSQGRILVTSDGQMKWGSGALAQDVVLQRGTAGQLLMTGGLVLNNTNGLVDTVIKGSTDSNLFYASASLDKIGIGISNPVGAFHISKNGGGNADLIVNQTDSTSNILTASSSGATKMVLDHSGNLGIGTNVFGSGAASVIGIAGSTKPTTTISGAQLWSENVAGTNELRVMDSAGNVTTLSPHNFSAIPDGKSDPMAWSFYSERNDLALNVDMLKAIRTVEALSGVQLAYEKDLTTGQYLPSSIPNSTVNSIATGSPVLANVLTQIADANSQLSNQVVHTADISPYATWSNQVWNFVSDVVFKLKATFQQQVDFLAGVVFHSPITVNQDTAGKVIIPAGASKVKVTFTQAFSSEPVVYLSPLENIVGGYALDSVSPTEFVVSLNLTQAGEVQLNWLALLQGAGTPNHGQVVDTGVVASPSPTSSPSSSYAPTATPDLTPTPTPTPALSPTPTMPSPTPTTSLVPSTLPTPSPSISPSPTPSSSPAPSSIISGSVAGTATTSASPTP